MDITLKERLIDAAVPLLAEKGLEATSFQALANKVRTGQTSCLYYFKNKIGLYREVVLSIVAKNHSYVESLISISDSAPARLVKYGQSNIEWVFKNPNEAKVILLLYYLSSFEPELRKIAHEIRIHARKKLLEYVYAAVREEYVAEDQDLAERVAAAHEALMGMLICYMSSDIKVSKAQLVKRWKLVLASLFPNE